MTETKPETPPEADSVPETETSGAASGSTDAPGGSATNAIETIQKATENKKEIGGRAGLDPTRYGDWEKAGRCIDF